MSSPQPPQETPDQKIKRLEKELEFSRFHNMLLDETFTIIDKEHSAGLSKWEFDIDTLQH